MPLQPSLTLQTALDEAFISAYNLFYTSLPVLALGVFDQDVKPLLTFKVCTSMPCTLIFHHKLSLCTLIVQHPKLYEPGQKSLFFNYHEFTLSAVQGFVASMVLFMIPIGEWSSLGRSARYRTPNKVGKELVSCMEQMPLNWSSGAYHNKTDDMGLGLANHELFSSVVATILVIVVTAQVREAGLVFLTFPSPPRLLWTQATGLSSITSPSGAA